MTFTRACQQLAGGRPLITVVPYLQHLLALKENDVYSTKGLPGITKKYLSRCEGARDMFWFLDSHGEHRQIKGIAKMCAEECLLGFGMLEFR
jgi:hypothetical protein